MFGLQPPRHISTLPCVTNAPSACNGAETVREMKEGPSRSAVRCRSQATASCCRQERWWCCVKKVRERHAVREMKEDPSEPSCRGRLQTAMSCFGQKLR